MNKITAFILLFCLVLLFSCDKKEEVDYGPLTKENISGESLWKRITEETDYTNYDFYPNHKGLLPGQAPHGVLHKVYINNTLSDALPIEERTAPFGTIIVKENYTADETLAAYTLMAKVDGYNPEHGDWFWAKYSSKGVVQAEGTPDGCISCHAGMKQNDYIIIHPLDADE